MAPALQRSSFSGSRLIRLLAALDIAEVTASKPTIAERTSLWLDWTDAIALAAALNGGQATRPALGKGTTKAANAAKAATAALTQLRSDFTASIAAGLAAVPRETGFAPLRRHCLSQQREMETRIGPLRAAVRATLSDCSAELARLAALDAAFDKALAARERHLLGTVPVLLEQRFERLRTSLPPEVSETQALNISKTPPAWWASYCRELQEILLAELEMRLQPIEGMIAALRRAVLARP